MRIENRDSFEIKLQEINYQNNKVCLVDDKKSNKKDFERSNF